MCRERRFSAVRSIRFNDLPVPVCRTVRVPAGYPQGHLHHECHRIAEQRDPCGDKETQSVLDGRLGSEGCLSGDQGCLKKMEYANPELATGDESFYYCSGQVILAAVLQ